MTHPYVVNALQKLEPAGKNDFFSNIVHLARIFDFSGRVGVNLESLPPGTRSSVGHAHSTRDEFVYVISGKGKVWLDGTVFGVANDDFVGFPAGTGIAHTFINDGGNEQNLLLLVVGENGRDDRVYYPLGEHEDPLTMRRDRSAWWKDPPLREMGKHDGRPSKPRRDDGSQSEASSTASNNPSSEDFWNDSIFHSLVLAAPNGLNGIESQDIALLSMFSNLSGRFSVSLHIVPPESWIWNPPVGHLKADELVYIIKGVGKVWIDGETEDITGGWAAGFPAGSGKCHTVINTGEKDLFVLVFTENFDDDEDINPPNPITA